MKNKKFVTILLLAALLVGCTQTNSSENSSSSSSQSSSEKHSSEVSSESSVNNTSSETSSEQFGSSSEVSSENSSSSSDSSITVEKSDYELTSELVEGEEFEISSKNGTVTKFQQKGVSVESGKMIMSSNGSIENIYTDEETHNAIVGLKDITVHGEGPSVTLYYGFSDDYEYGNGLTSTKAYSTTLVFGETFDFEGKQPCFILLKNNNETNVTIEKIELNVHNDSDASLLDSTSLLGFEEEGNNVTYAGKYGAVIEEKAGNGWSSLKSTTSSKNWYLKAHLTDLVEESHAGGSWESIGLGMVDANGKHMQFTYWKPDSNADKTNRVGNFGLIDETGAIIKQCIPSTVYSCDDLNLAIHREDNLYHFYINDLMALTYDFSNSANYDSSGNDYPSLITRGVGCTYSNVELYYGDEIDAQLPKTINPDYAYSTSYKTEGLVDTSKYLSDGIVSFKASNQDTVSYRALATYNYVGDTFSIKAKFSGFDRTAGLVALGIKAGNAESVSINNAWGKANLFGLFLQNGTTVKIGARTDAYNDSRTYSVEWADALTGDFELEIRWIKGKYYCNFIGHNSDGTSVESGWIYWNLTTNGYYGRGVNGDRMSAVIG